MNICGIKNNNYRLHRQFVANPTTSVVFNAKNLSVIKDSILLANKPFLQVPSFGMNKEKKDITDVYLRSVAQELEKKLPKGSSYSSLDHQSFSKKKSKCKKNLKDAELVFGYVNANVVVPIVRDEFRNYFVDEGKRLQVEKYARRLSTFFNTFLNSTNSSDKTMLKKLANEIKSDMINDLSLLDNFSKNSSYYDIEKDFRDNLKKSELVAKVGYVNLDTGLDIAIPLVQVCCNSIGRVNSINTNKKTYLEFIEFFKDFERYYSSNEVNVDNRLESISQSERVIDTVVKPDNQIKRGLLEEYEKRYSEYKEFVKTVRNRIKTEEEKVEEERLRKAYLSVLEQARKENVSFVRKRVETEFSQDPIKNKEEKLEYIKKEVLGQMKVSEKSAIDGLEMFEKYGSRFEYANGRKSYEYLAESVMYRPKEDLSDRLLSKFIDVWEKISVKDDKKYKDNETLRSVLVHFTDGIKNATEETLLKGISLLKKLTNQREDAERLGYTLLQAPQAQYKDSERIKQAIEDLTQYVKDYPQYYRLPEVL